MEPELQFPATPDSRGWTWHCVLMLDMYELHWRTREVRSIRAKAAAIDLKRSSLRIYTSEKHAGKYAHQDEVTEEVKQERPDWCAWGSVNNSWLLLVISNKPNFLVSMWILPSAFLLSSKCWREYGGGLSDLLVGASVVPSMTSFPFLGSRDSAGN